MRLSPNSLLLMALACLALTAATLLLLTQNRALKKRVLVLQGPVIGTTLPPLRGMLANGEAHVVEYGVGSGGRATVLFVLSPTCGVCVENMTQWENLASKLDSDTVRLIVVNASPLPLGALEQYISRFPDATILAAVVASDVLSYQFRATPQTIFIDNHGNVQGVWVGLLEDSSVADISTLVSTMHAPVRTKRKPLCLGLPCRTQQDCGTKCRCEIQDGQEEGSCVGRSH